MPRLQVDWTSTLDEVAEVNGADRRRHRFGYRRIAASHGRTDCESYRLDRLYREFGLARRRRKRRRNWPRLAAAQTETMTMAKQRWSIDSVSDTIAHGRPFRAPRTNIHESIWRWKRIRVCQADEYPRAAKPCRKPCPAAKHTFR
jgi:hypothetical protein